MVKMGINAYLNESIHTRMGQGEVLVQNKQPIDPDFQQQVKKTVQQAQQNIRKQVSLIEMEENMIKNELRKYRNDPTIMKIYARGLVVSRREKAKMVGQISCLSQMETNVRMALMQNKVAKVYGDLAPMFSQLNSQLTDPLYRNAMKQFAMSNEQLAAKMGLVDEQLDDMFAVDDEEKVAENEIDAVIAESLGKLADLQVQKLDQQQQQQVQTAGQQKDVQ